MRVLYVNMGGALVAGSERSLLDLIAAGADRIEALVLCNSPALAAAAERLGAASCVADLVELSPYGSPRWAAGCFLRGVRAVVSCIDRFRPALIHANNVWPTQLAATAALVRHCPVVGFVRATTFRSGRDLSLLRLADHIVAVSEQVARPFRRMRLRRGQVSVIFDPVRVDAGAIIGRGADDEPLRLAIAGRLSSEKAVHRAVDLLGWLREQGLEAELTVFGDGPQRPALEERVAKAKLKPFVEFAGFCENLPQRLAAFDALLLSSLREALPRVIVEAGLVGVPAVATAVGGIAEVIDSGQTGLLVDDLESPANRRAVLDLLRDRRGLRRMGRQMQQFCRRHFAPAAAFEATMAVYRRVLARRPPHGG